MTSFHDPSLKNGIFLIELVDAVKPGTVDFALIEKDGSDKSNLLNAKYAISIGRKAGAVIFALPEDIVEVKNKMLMTFIAGMMAISLSG